MESMLLECEVSDFAYEWYLRAKGQTVAAVRRQIQNEAEELRRANGEEPKLHWCQGAAVANVG